MARARAAIVVHSSTASGASLVELLGTPDRVWDKGDPTGSTSKARVPKSGWAIESTSDDSAPAGDHITEILGRSAGLTRKIHELLATGVVDSAQFWVHLNSPISGISLTADELRAIAEIGSLEVDIYS